jgi:hypothetical protein
MPRENLRTIDLADHHQPLAANRPLIDDDVTGGRPEAEDGTKYRKPVAKVVEMYPSLAAPPREHLIPFSARIPLSMLDELDALCTERKIDKSALVRDFIAAGLSHCRE